jgi:hypothetical protein
MDKENRNFPKLFSGNSKARKTSSPSVPTSINRESKKCSKASGMNIWATKSTLKKAITLATAAMAVIPKSEDRIPE